MVYYRCVQNKNTYKTMTAYFNPKFETREEAVEDYLKAEKIAKERFNIFKEKLNNILDELGNYSRLGIYYEAGDDTDLIECLPTFETNVNGYHFQFCIEVW